MLKKVLLNAGVSVILIALLIGIFGYIRYDQLTWSRENARQEKAFAEIEYRGLLINDRNNLNDRTAEFIEIFKDKSSKKSEVIKTVDRFKYECDLSLRGLLGNVDPITQYRKDLTRPEGYFEEEHNRYFNSIKETAKILVEIKKELTSKEPLSKKEKSQFIRRLEAEIAKIEDI